MYTNDILLISLEAPNPEVHSALPECFHNTHIWISSNILQTISKHGKKEGGLFVCLFQNDVVATLSLFKIHYLFRTVNVLCHHGFLIVESSLF